MEWNIGWAYSSATAKNEYCRAYTRANVEPSTKLNTGSMFYAYTETTMGGSGEASIVFPIPTVLPAKTDIRVVMLASAAGGIGSTVLRGFLVS